MNVYIKQIVIDDLLRDTQLRMKLALILGVTEQGILKMAKKVDSEKTPNSSLTKLAAINFFRAEGYSDKDIYEEIPA